MRFREKFIRFMYGRYGMDQYGKFLLYGSLILLIISSLFKFAPIYLIALAGIVYGYFRIFSKNIYKRQFENDRYLKTKAKVCGFFSNLFGKFKKQGNNYSSRCNSYRGNSYTMEYKIFKCPKCKQKLRVPRGKGRIQISCKRCGNEFIKRT